jgi:hypothetical protein
MRAFFTTTVRRADDIFRSGFTNLYEFGGINGVCFTDRQLDARDGFVGEVTLYLEIPDDVFSRWEWVEDGGGLGLRLSLIPADVLNQLGRPQVYDHAFAGMSRRDMVQAIKGWEQQGDWQPAHQLREAMEFLDRIGWLTPVKVQEQRGLSVE